MDNTHLYEKLKTRMDKLTIFDDVMKPRAYIDSGMLPFNYILSLKTNGGYPQGRIIEIYGPESCGKSTLGYCSLAQAQRDGAYTMLIDSEGVFDKEQALRCGIDPSNLIYLPPTDANTIFNYIAQTIETLYVKEKETKPLMIVQDSVASSSLYTSIESMDKNPQAELARILSVSFNKINPLITTNPVTYIGLNQIRITSRGNNIFVEESPGGRALKFYSSIRVKMKREKEWKEDDKTIGIIASATTTKNKIERFGYKCLIPIRFDSGLDPITALLDLAKDTDIIKTSGPYLKWNDENKFKKDWYTILVNDASIKKSLEDSVTQAIGEKIERKPVSEIDDFKESSWKSEDTVNETGNVNK